MTVDAAVSAALENMQAPRLPLQNLLRRQRGDDFFEPRVAAKGIPPRHQFQFAIAELHTAKGASDGSGKLFAGEIFFTNPRSSHRQILDHDHAIDWVLFNGKKLDRAASFAQGRLLPPESGIDYSEHAPCRAVIWLSLSRSLLR